jgi:hypothetical protein
MRRGSVLAQWLARDGCRTIRAPEGCIVTALEGRVWMTVEGDADDYWLEPGEALPLAPGERARISGWRESVCYEVQPLAPVHTWRFARLRVGMQVLRVRLARRVPHGPADARARAVKARVA